MISIFSGKAPRPMWRDSAGSLGRSRDARSGSPPKPTPSRFRPQADQRPLGAGCVIVGYMTSGSEFGSGRRASAQLPLYGVEGWPGRRRIGSSSEFGLAGRGGAEPVLMSVGVIHSHGEASITVTSHRQPGNGLEALRRWVSKTAIRAALREHADDESGHLQSPARPNDSNRRLSWTSCPGRT